MMDLGSLGIPISMVRASTSYIWVPHIRRRQYCNNFVSKWDAVLIPVTIFDFDVRVSSTVLVEVFHTQHL